jgi:hypothetical protein
VIGADQRPAQNRHSHLSHDGREWRRLDGTIVSGQSEGLPGPPPSLGLCLITYILLTTPNCAALACKFSPPVRSIALMGFPLHSTETRSNRGVFNPVQRRRCGAKEAPNIQLNWPESKQFARGHSERDAGQPPTRR